MLDICFYSGYAYPDKLIGFPRRETGQIRPIRKEENVDIRKEDLIAMYRWMFFVREFEMATVRVYAQKGLPETPHTCVGQEAVGVGTCYGLRRDDFVLPSLRGRSVVLTKGADPSVVMAGSYAKATGPSGGKITAHHMGDLGLGILAGSAVIGSQFPTCVGVALAFKMRKTDQVCLCYFGDGASNRGDFHEGLNLAAILKVPVIFICENNCYAITTPVGYSMCVEDIGMRAHGYGIPGITVDGNDVLAVYEASQAAIARARRGEGPTLIECKTYRLRPHSERSRTEDRPAQEVQSWWERCPIKRLKQKLADQKILDEAGFAKIDEECKDIVNRAVKFAEESPYPQPETAVEGVYAMGQIKGGRLCL
jgi:pyruvate dehydrogenase E1 component alpha subunit